MSATYVQGTNGSNGTSPVVSESLAYTSNVTAGNLLIAMGGWYSNTATDVGASCADTQGNNWQQAVYCGQNNAYALALFWAVAKASGPDTPTITFPASVGYTQFFIHEFSGVNALDVVSTGITVTGTSCTTTAVQTNYPSELLFAAFNSGGTITTVGSGYTQAQLNGSLTEYQVVSSTGSYSASASGTGSDDWEGVFASFYLASTVVKQRLVNQAPTRAAIW